jgi:hypothetical protein
MKRPRFLIFLIALAACAVQAAEAPLVLIERSQAALRSDPDASRRLADEAPKAVAAQPDADLQIHAHLLLCDYYSERDGAAAQREIEQARTLMAQSKRTGLRAGLLSCAGELSELDGDNVQANGAVPAGGDGR